MSRPGVTYQDIVNAIAELKGQGKNITIENIRAFLGTGSIGTINKYLRQWRDIQSASKENLPEELVSLMQKLWESFLTTSLQRFEVEITGLKAELEKVRHNNRRWQKLFDQWQQEQNKLVNEKAQLEFQIKQMQELVTA